MKQMRDASIDMLVDLARPTLEDVVLDYASGAGIAGFAVAPDVESVESADEDPGTLEEGRRLAEELGLVNVAFTLVDLYSLPFKDASFSLVVCRDALHRLPDPATALAEMQRVLAARGRVVLLDTVVNSVTDKAFNDLARLREPAHRRHYLPPEIDEIVETAGFAIKRRETLRGTIDLDYWLQAAAVPPPKAELIRSRFKQLPVEVLGHLDIAFADRLVSFSYDVTGLRLERA